MRVCFGLDVSHADNSVCDEYTAVEALHCALKSHVVTIREHGSLCTDVDKPVIPFAQILLAYLIRNINLPNGAEIRADFSRCSSQCRRDVVTLSSGVA